MRSIARFGLPFGFGLLMLAGCATTSAFVGEKPTVALRRVDLTRITYQGLTATFVFGITNPNGFALDLARFDYDVALDNRPLAHGNGLDPLHLPPNGTGQMLLPVTIRFADLAQDLASLFMRPTLPYVVTAEMGMAAPSGMVELPIHEVGDVPLPQLPRVRLERAVLSELDIGGATLTVEVEVENSNAFAVPLGQMRYKLSIDETGVAAGVASPTELAAHAAQLVRLTTRIDFQNIALTVASAIRTRHGSVVFEAEVDLGSLKLPLRFDTPIAVKG
jgi:LEA14-like dessication related protein